MDEPASAQPAKKGKPGKAALKRLKAAEKKKAKKRGDIDSSDDSDDDTYTALSKSMKANAASPSVRPPVGTLEVCAKCEKEFSVV
jgi:DNA repair protein RAD7